jgi:CRISPR-associated protein Csd1
MLLRNTQHHLSRLRKDKPGLAVMFDNEMGEIMDQLESAFPRTLGMESQGRFAIGYYQETQARFQKVKNQIEADVESEEEIQ